MKIGIDCSATFFDNRTGVGNYTYNLVNALVKIDKDNHYTLYPVFYNILPNTLKKIEFKDRANSKVVFRRMPILLASVLWPPFIPSALKEYMLGDVEIVHSTTYSAPRFRDKRKRLVVTIYDLTFLTHPECHTKVNIKLCSKGVYDAAKYADAIIAISHHTKKDLINYLKIPEELITVTHLAADSDFSPVTDAGLIEVIRKKYNLPGQYVLFVGSLEPRKNIKSLLKAYSILPERLKKDFSLVIAGAKGWLNSDIPVMVKELNIAEKVHFPGYIEKNDLSALYSLASVFVYPSLYEGFGLPILEAMACGTPVISSNTSSMPEVAGDAAELVAPTCPEEISNVLEKVLMDEGRRAEMKEKGIRRAAEFSWERCAGETLGVYKKVIASGKRN